MTRHVALSLVGLLLLVSLSGCLGSGDGDGEGIGDRSPEDVDGDDYNVLYIGHSFGRQFAERMEDLAHDAGYSDHAQYIEFSGGESGSPGLLWEDAQHQANIKAFLDTGEIDVLIMICCSPEFMETLDTDQAVWNFTSYALDKNPATRIGLAMPWKDFPEDHENASAYRDGSDVAYDAFADLGRNLSSDFSNADVFSFHHGAVVYELRDMFEAGEIEDDVEQMTGPRATSLFTDAKGHAATITLEAGSLVWLFAVHGVDPMDMPAYPLYEVDIREVAQRVIEPEARD